MSSATRSMPTVQTPATRRTDPDTSLSAERGITQSGHRGAQQYIVRHMVKRWPGRTSAELSRYAAEHSHDLAVAVFGPNPKQRERSYCRLDRWQVARRLPEIEPMYAERGPVRRCSIAGRKSLTWWPT